jgi:uracil-DNA glycosylase family 4
MNGNLPWIRVYAIIEKNIKENEDIAMYQSWDELESNCKGCTKCGLCETRNHVVVGVGNRNAEVMFIGEGPGENEDLQGEPFVGRGGQLLDKMLNAVDLDRNKNIYIANIVKCRPPQNRDPLQEEQDACIDWLRNQVLLLKPKIIVCLGRIAGMKIIKPDLKITKEHGVFYEKNGIFMMATLHPAALLRNPAQKPGAFEDFLKLRDKIKEICDHTYTQND